jgi:hypothetical protein
MKTAFAHRWLLVLALNAVVLGVLGLYGSLVAAPQAGQPPFANPIDQRAEMVRELREIKELLKEQNALLRSSLKPDANPLAPR